MAAIDRFILLVRDLRREQSGMAVPTALMALIASFALASVAVVSTVNVQQGSRRDHDSKEAIAAADAGANVALLRLNRFLPSLSVANPCLGPSGEAQAASGGWCPTSPTETVGNGTYSYRISAYTSSGELNIVSVGSSGGVDRRVNVTLKTVSGKNVFAEEKLIGEEKIEFSGSSPRIETDLGSNGDITTSGNSHPTVCGNERHGVGKEADPTPTCEGEKLEGDKALPPIIPPANIATVNSNCRLNDTCANGEEDTVSKNNALDWNSTTRVLDLGSQGTLTMSGTDYFVCRLILHPGTVFMPVGRNVRIFVDTPANCNLPSGEVQVEITGSSNISSTGFNPSQGFFAVPGIYVLGNGTVNLAGNSGSNEMMLYAPNSYVDIQGNASWNGMIAAKSLNIHGSVTIESDPRIKPPEITLASVFERTRYVECTGATATPPNANC
jgi:hypothetical protein